MTLSELLNKASQPEVTKTASDRAVKSEEVEKLASVLEAFAEEDTLLDDLARAAVVADMLEKNHGQKGNA